MLAFDETVVLELLAEVVEDAGSAVTMVTRVAVLVVDEPVPCGQFYS